MKIFVLEHAENCKDGFGWIRSRRACGGIHEEMYRILEAVVPYLPIEKPTYLMNRCRDSGKYFGKQLSYRGVDFWLCISERNGRHGHVYTNQGKLNLFNAQNMSWMTRRLKRAASVPRWSPHLPFQSVQPDIFWKPLQKEMLGWDSVCCIIYFYNNMMEGQIRAAVDAGI